VKHIFWIISGVIILALLVTWFWVVPADDAREVKKNLDKSSLDLKDLEKRAKNQPSRPTPSVWPRTSSSPSAGWASSSRTSTSTRTSWRP
jgi:hypothetical protein